MPAPTEWPQWAETLVIIMGVIGTGAAAMFTGFKRGSAPPPPSGDTQVIAGSFMDKQALVDLRVSVANADGTMRSLCGEVKELRETMEAVAHQLELDRVARGRG